MRKRKKTHKGMTLVEIIVSLAVVGIMTLVMVKASHAITKYTMSANNVDRKVTEQAPLAEVKYKDWAYSYGDEVTINLQITSGASSSVSATVKGETYAIVDPSTIDPSLDESRIAGDKLNMKFVILKEPEESETPEDPGETP